MTRPRPILATSLTCAVPLALVLTACGDGSASKDSKGGNNQAAAVPTCATADTTALRLAVLDYITIADPRPQRFLSAFGTDSALPEDGFKALQDKGPTYYYNDNPKNQAQVRQKLAEAGPYTSMLVVFKGQAESDNGNTVQVTLGGHYVGGEHDGKLSPQRVITVRCDSTGWRLPSSTTAPAAPTSDSAPATGA
jgi:hypothetical protein